MTVEEYIQKLTLEEKAVLLQGQTVWNTWPISRLLLPEMTLADGPHGLRKAKSANQLTIKTSVPATCFPTAATMANSWDPELGEELGRALGAEAAANDVHVVLGPGLNIKRSPLCGRNFEYFSEDPYLAGKMAAGYIRGIQSNGVAACPKHFAANSQELRRMSADSVVDERTLREIYLTGFEIAVKEGKPKALMSSYNPVNGTYANENPHLLQEILREEWGFDGFVVSDWGGCNDPVAAVAAGSGLNMPNPGLDNARLLVEAVREGELPESVLDDRLRELLSVVLSTTDAVEAAPKTFDAWRHHQLAKKCAAGSIVLLDNDGILPLSPRAKTAVIGDFARLPRYQGAGSSQVNPTRMDNLLDALKKDLSVTFAQGYRRGKAAADATLIQHAVSAASAAEVVLLCVGLDEISECEGRDRSNLELPESQQALIRAVCKVNSNVVLVLSGGAPFVLPPRTSYRAAVHGYLGGQAGALAMADVLMGRTNPSGKLAESWPERLEDTPCFHYYPGAERTAEYREGLYVGYRYYDTAGVPVRYPFGHGLSYTTFAYSNLEANSRQVSFTLTNTGSRDGAEVAQIYISCRVGKVFRPVRELKGFRKVFLKAGESRRVTVALDDKAFRYFNVKTNRWEMETAHYVITVGDQKITLRLFGTDAPVPYGTLPSYESGTITDVPDGEFAQLLGRDIPQAQWDGPMGLNDPIARFATAKTPAARWLCKFLNRKVEKQTEKPDMTYDTILNLPIRGLAQMTGGRITRAMTEDVLYWADGHFFRGSRRLIRGFFDGRKAAFDFGSVLDFGPEEE